MGIKSKMILYTIQPFAMKRFLGCVIFRHATLLNNSIMLLFPALIHVLYALEEYLCTFMHHCCTYYTIWGFVYPSYYSKKRISTKRWSVLPHVYSSHSLTELGVRTEKKTWTNTAKRHDIKSLLSLNGQKVIQKQLAHTEFSRKH